MIGAQDYNIKASGSIEPDAFYINRFIDSIL